MLFETVFLILTETLIDGKPLLNLPKKIVSMMQIDFSPSEREFYTKLEAKYRKKFQVYRN